MKTPEAELQELRIAVAEGEGAKNYVRPWDGKVFLCPECPTLRWTETHLPADKVHSDIPDFPADRNAIIGAIVRRFVTREQMTAFSKALVNECHGKHPVASVTANELFALATATAEQLCRAYLSAAEPPAEGQPK